MSRRLIFGGTFNPVHFGHLRAAIEAAEALGFDDVELVPSFSPHHKEGAGLLRFDLRVELVRAALQGHARFRVNEIEKTLPVPSFTIRTLEAIARVSPDDERHFLLGNREFLRLHKWVRGRDIAALYNLVIACRIDLDLDAFEKGMAQAWPGLRRSVTPIGALPAFELVPGRYAVLLPLPQLEVSSSLLRCRWLEGRDLAYLLPAGVIDLLEAHRPEVSATWGASAPS